MSKFDIVLEELRNNFPIGSELTKHDLWKCVHKSEPSMNEATIGFCISKLIILGFLSFVCKDHNAHRYNRFK